ncbi:hypothetical protein sekstaphage1_p27 [Escherichia phage Sekstaphage-1]|uniref:Uncharacterized protein n=1 Tax=Escherichia phage Sekstaphage-1 TaxID=3076820 RepID=A0AA96PNN3_9CAUD|nr:hypothetical protein sekstaphage1_p27 [Escherichia phage Sekstaphage-1]
MCWQPKVKVPKMDTNQIRAAEPAPLIEPPKSVVWGGDDEDTSVSSSEVASRPSSGKNSLKVKLDDSAAKNKSKSSIRSKAFG